MEKLIREGIIEFVDGYERENRAIVSFENDITDDTTHLELLPPLRLDTTYERYLQILEEPWDDSYFLPFSWSYFFYYNSLYKVVTKKIKVTGVRFVDY